MLVQDALGSQSVRACYYPMLGSVSSLRLRTVCPGLGFGVLVPVLLPVASDASGGLSGTIVAGSSHCDCEALVL
eukprot:2128268-Amphidinium_carterae.1